MSGLSWSEHVRLEAAAERRATDEAFVRLLERRDRRRRALRWFSWRQVVCDPVVAASASEGLPASPSGAVPGTPGAAPYPAALRIRPPGRLPHERPGRPTH